MRNAMRKPVKSLVKVHPKGFPNQGIKGLVTYDTYNFLANGSPLAQPSQPRRPPQVSVKFAWHDYKNIF